jgi:hypothetical protein
LATAVARAALDMLIPWNGLALIVALVPTNSFAAKSVIEMNLQSCCSLRPPRSSLRFANILEGEHFRGKSKIAERWMAVYETVAAAPLLSLPADPETVFPLGQFVSTDFSTLKIAYFGPRRLPHRADWVDQPIEWAESHSVENDGERGTDVGSDSRVIQFGTWGERC